MERSDSEVYNWHFFTADATGRNELGPISVTVREVTPATSPSNPASGPGLLTTASVTAQTPPAEPATTTTSNTPSPSGQHLHFQGKVNFEAPSYLCDSDNLTKVKPLRFSGLHFLRATGSLFGSLFGPLLPQSTWLYNPLSYHPQQYIMDQDWQVLALRMAQQRRQRPDQTNLEDLRKLRSASTSPGGSPKSERRRNGAEGQQDDDIDHDTLREVESPDGSIEVDDRNDNQERRLTDLARSEDSLIDQDSPRISGDLDLDDNNSTRDGFTEASKRLRPSIENLNDSDVQADLEPVARRSDLTVKIKLEGTVDLSTKRGCQDKENVGQDLTTTRRKDDEVEVERESVRPRTDRSPKPRHVWRPY